MRKNSVGSFTSTLLLSAVLCVGPSGYAARSEVVQESEVTQATFEDVRVVQPKRKKPGSKKQGKKKTVLVEVQCYQGEAGQIKREKSGMLIFRSYQELVKQQTKKLRRVKSSVARAKLVKTLKSLKKLKAKGNEACSGVGNNIEQDSPAAAISGLEPFEGEFGPSEARILGERFAFSFTPEQVREAVEIGLEATVARMQEWNPNSVHLTFPGNPPIANMVGDLACDGYLKGEELDGSDDSAERECNPRNLTDRDISGVRSRLYLEAFGSNAYHAKLVQFLSDECEAPTLSFAASRRGYYHLAESYLSDLWQAAVSGDYKQYIRNIFVPSSGSGYASAVLNVIGNKDPQIPNEDGARELLELGTVGHKTLDGRLNYGPADIANNALAFTGWVWSEISQAVGEAEPMTILVPSFSSAAFVDGVKVLFIEDPENRSTVRSMEDSIEAALRHPEAAVELAEKICKEFIARRCSHGLVKAIAKEVISTDFDLNAVLAKIMKSKVLYAPETRNKLIKHPMELYLGFLKAAGFPAGKEPLSFRSLERLVLEPTGQRAFLPPSIFGFYEDQLAAEARVLDRRTACFNIMASDPKSLEEKIGYSIRSRFMTDLPQAEDDSLAVVDKMAATFNVTLSSRQRDAAARFLNHYRDDECQQYEVNQNICSQSQLGQAFERRDRFDVGSGAWKYVERVQGLMVMFCQKYDYQTK